MTDRDKEREEIKNDIIKEGDELRKSLLDKLFTLNTILSAAFLVLYQLDKSSFQIKVLNVLPFCSVVLILVYQLIDFRAIGFAYHKLNTWKDGDMKSLEAYKLNGLNVVMLSIIMTIIELGYLFTILLDL